MVTLHKPRFKAAWAAPLLLVILAVPLRAGAQSANPCAGVPDGALCDDSSSCTVADRCRAGICTGVPVADGELCIDRNSCVFDGRCRMGRCLPLPGVDAAAASNGMCGQDAGVDARADAALVDVRGDGAMAGTAGSGGGGGSGAGAGGMGGGAGAADALSDKPVAGDAAADAADDPDASAGQGGGDAARSILYSPEGGACSCSLGSRKTGPPVGWAGLLLLGLALLRRRL